MFLYIFLPFLLQIKFLNFRMPNFKFELPIMFQEMSEMFHEIPRLIKIQQIKGLIIKIVIKF